ncbi:MAG: hypothetical protein K0S23_977 [Fluviicola sp.]|jgi:hypothetical protein|uniref:hypothetical protein n=1 Tax=Fluviicola sp. TaxID=1917219 RepID=UPI0026245EAB|nr:hypothetical protein [Fluviicola sp.]MDF3026670.1 hypothetical protein [Fluviicola sp.]
MKNIEQIIKKSLENHELPYNEAAWESLSKRLDGTTPSPFYRKWWVAASVGTVLVGSALFFALNSQSESARTKENAPVISQNTTAEQTNNHLEGRLDKNEYTSPQTNTHQTEKQVSNGTQSAPVENGNNQNNENHLVQTSKGEANSATQNSQGSLKNPSDDGGAQKTNYLPANTNKTRYCIGDEIEIANPNDNSSVSVIQNNRTILIVKPGTKKVFAASNEGTIDLVVGNQKQTISVSKPSSDLYISVDPTLLYEDGVPAIRFTVSGNHSPVHWTVEKHAFESEDGTLIVHPYKGKEISVSASAKDQNGCAVVEQKRITLSEDYNLNAQEAIDLNSNDSRVSTFMPHALKERKTPFELYIYDTKSGRVIYKTTDVSAGWNGVDSNTGEVLKNGAVVLWKVVMGNPNPGEPREYKGTIVIRTQ